ncbi:MAG: hypothetical protein ACUVQ1_03975 [Candidatus Kapaibacteriales bacterium]
MNRFKLYFCLLLFSNSLFSQWSDISINPTTSRIYDLDARIYSLGGIITIDTITAVGWNYSSGFVYFTTNGGRDWDTLLTTMEFFPFAIKFLPGNRFFVAGYNYLQDEANVYVYDELTQQSLVYYFDGNSLPYCKNLFDFSLVSNSLFACGYNGKIFRWSLVENQWEEMQTNSNLVFVQIKATETFSDTGIVINGFALAGKLFDHPTQIFRFNPETNEWRSVIDFTTISKSFVATSFDTFAGDSLHPFSLLVAGTSNDTILLFRSTDFGNNWELVFQLPTLNVPIGVLHNKISYFIDDAGNIWKSNDFGRTWNQIHQDKSMDFYKAKIFSTSIDTLNLSLKPTFFFGIGSNGKIRLFRLEEILAKEESMDNDLVFEFVKVYDILGNEIAKINSTFQLSKFFENCRDGIYLICYLVGSQKVKVWKAIKTDGHILVDN